MLAIVPVNSAVSAKRRLAPLLSRAQRAELVSVMLGDVVAACRASTAASGVLVVTPDPSLAPPGTEALADRGGGHAAAIAAALRDPRAAAGAIVVMADCPLVRPETIAELADRARPVALCPAQDGGTNALALRPADAIEPAFGVRGGAAILVARARSRGYEPVVLDDPLVALDVDLPDDVRRLLELGGGTSTARFLDRCLAVPAECRVGGE